ncbi:MAG: Mov34/MPN/PAD-1 family protein [Thermoplasmata archaeon]|nr:Mov34/MPN/PAD-1 family protein [Thermoplasmata archaeon]
MLLGSQRPRAPRIDSYVELRNIADGGSAFRADPRELRSWIYPSGRSPSLAVGFFHSHPAAPARPSSLDSRAAACGYWHGIIGQSGDLRLFVRERPGTPLRDLDVRSEPELAE